MVVYTSAVLPETKETIMVEDHGGEFRQYLLKQDVPHDWRSATRRTLAAAAVLVVIVTVLKAALKAHGI